VTDFYPKTMQHAFWTEGTNESEAGRRNTTKLLRERLSESGVSSLSTPELLSIILRTGSGSESIVAAVHTLLASYSLQELLHVDFGNLRHQYGLGEAKAAQLQALLETARRLTIPSHQSRYAITTPQDAANLVMPDMAFLDHEELRVLVLDTKHGVVANLLLYQGTINSSVLRAAEILRPAVTRNCPGIIMCHNHPSGDPAPSREDEQVTRQMIAAAKLCDIDLVDHLIIGSNHRFVSLKERLRWE
jgi:DNA repair protein RadC